MKPLYLKLTNFMNHSFSEIDFTKFESNSVVIIGKENDSDAASIGVGKTNLFNSIKYAVYNSKILSKKEDIIKDGTNKCTVEFVFKAIDDSIFKIIRYRTKTTNGVEFYKLENGNWNPISGRTSSHTDEAIINVIGVSEQSFENSSYIKQNDFKRARIDTLAAATPEQRKDIIIDILQLGIWGTYESAAKKTRDEISKEIISLSAKLDIYQINDNDVSKIKETLTNIEKESVAINKEISKKQEIIENLKVKLLQNKALISNDSSKLKDEIKNDQSYVNQLNKTINSLQQQIADQRNNLSNNEHLLKTTKELLTNKQAELNDFKKEKRNKPSENVYNNLVQDVYKYKSIIGEYNGKLLIASKPIPKTESCDTCGTVLNEDNRSKLQENKQKQIDEFTNTILNYNIKVNDLLSEKSVLDKELEEYSAYITKINKLEKEINSINIQSIELVIASLSENIKGNEENLLIKLKEIDYRKVNLKEKIDKLKLIDNDSIETIVKDLQAKIKNEQTLLEMTKAKQTAFVYEKAKLEADINNKKENVRIYNSLLPAKKELEEKLKYYKAAVACFSSSGIPALIIHTVLASLQQETNEIIEKLVPGLQCQFVIDKEKADGTKANTLEIVYYLNGFEKDFLALSGGQQSAIVLAMKLAIVKISKNRCGASVQILLLDEVDAALDQRSIDYFNEVVNDIAKEDIIVLVISHNDRMKGKFKSTIIVNKVGDNSEARGYNV